MNNLQIWNYEGTEVRTVEVNGEPWFVGKDVATVLGYAKPPNALSTHVCSPFSGKNTKTK